MLRWSLLVILLAGCADPYNESDADVGQTDASTDGDAPVVAACTPGNDADGDGIADEVEGCDGTDTDGDGIEDYADTDSDDDGIADSIEGAEDPDNDGKPNFQDRDSDDDGISDDQEDPDGDGFVGCCLTKCNEPRPGCAVEASGCGLGQRCEAGSCTPPVDFACSDGESDPTSAATFGENRPDAKLPTFVCRPPGETSFKGLKPMQFLKSTEGKWLVAIEEDALAGPAAIIGAKPKEAAANFDLTAAEQAVAGFIISKPAPAGSDVGALVSSLIGDIKMIPGNDSVAQISSGTQGTSHDKYSTVVSTQVRIVLAAPKRPPTVRNALLSTLLGKSLGKLPADGWGPETTEHLLRFQTLLRDDERVIVIGAVAAEAMAIDASKLTGIHLDDLSNGTGLATDEDKDSVECDPFLPADNPVADIIWVVDESGSVKDNREDIAANAKEFFARATASGLDFRMGVAGMQKEADGTFCSVASTDEKHPGGDDRFLGPDEHSLFEACINNPPGYQYNDEYGLISARNAVESHLPRAANDPSKIRPDAALVIIFTTDEAAKDWLDTSWLTNEARWKCEMGAELQGPTDALIAPDLALYSGKDAKWGAAASATAHMIGGVCNNACDTEVSHGYNEVVAATAGLVADVCQADLSASLQVIIDSIIGQASPVKLQYVPISASLAVAVGDEQIPRSRTAGFDYSPATNSVIFIGTPFPKDSQVAVSYRRFERQVTLK